jgi:hypothetical protein
MRAEVIPFVLVLAACGGQTVQKPAGAPGAGAGAAGSGAGAAGAANGVAAGGARGGDGGAARTDPWALPPAPAPESPPVEPGDLKLDAWQRAAKAKGVGAAPAACAAFARRAPAKARPESVATALAERDAGARDAMLVALEAAANAAPNANANANAGAAGADLPPGALRALRADLAPIECGDAIVDPYLRSKAASGVRGVAGHALVGLSLAAKLARTAHAPPAMAAGTRDKAKVKAFVQGPLKAWMVEQASAIEALSAAGRALSGYGRAVAAVEAGTADLRLVDDVRSAPLPKEWDAELKQVYEAALDEALEPRKTRGRDAALVGLADFARIGSLHDARVDRARAILSKLYGGRRIDALDRLLLPPAAGTTGAAGGASSLWRALGGGRSADRPTARVWFERGRLTWERRDFVEAAYAARGDEAEPPREPLVLALSLALAHGPANAAEMMRAPSRSALGLAHTEALDALAAQGGADAGIAAFDAAHLRSLCAPDGSAAGPYLREVAARFRRAESLLTDPTHKKLAASRAAEADAAAAAIAGH